MPHHDTIAQTLITWFKANERDLPWRKTYTPYHIWISEIMLQQTQMDRAVPYFTRWMERFPKISDIAVADEDEILKYWEGLGYYSRARNIRKAARRIVEEHEGIFPVSRKDILALPGIGPYTAGAIMSLAFEADEPAIDANVERVYARLFDIDTPMAEKETKQRVRALSDDLLPTGHARNYNQAVMEFGALVCTPRSPRCNACPLTGYCEAYRLGITAHRPVPGKKKDITPLDVVTGFLIHDGKVYIQKRPEGSVWAGLWEFPGGHIEAGEPPEQTVVREYREETGFDVEVTDKVSIIRHGYTTFRITLHCFVVRLKSKSAIPDLCAATEYKWLPPSELSQFAFPGGHRKLLDQMRSDIRYAHIFQNA